MQNSWIPYVYFLKNKSLGLKYVGVRYAKGCSPDDFWVTYFTSSKLVKKLIEHYGKDDFVFKILHTFPNDPHKAILKEAEYFSLLKKKENYLNICYSSGLQDLRMNSKAGKVGGAIVRDKKIGIFRSEEDRKLWASAGGKIGGKTQLDMGIGIHAQTKEEKLALSSLGGKTNSLRNDWGNKQKQANRGRRGGIKNKGFKWFTDGHNDHKYTLYNQQQLSFDAFLEQNKQFKRGRK